MSSFCNELPSPTTANIKAYVLKQDDKVNNANSVIVFLENPLIGHVFRVVQVVQVVPMVYDMHSENIWFTLP